MKASKKQREIVDDCDYYRVLMWASHEVRSRKDKHCQAYSWVPKLALSSNTVLRFAQRILAQDPLALSGLTNLPEDLKAHVAKYNI